MNSDLYFLEAAVKLNSALRQVDTRDHTISILLGEGITAYRADAAAIYEIHGSELVYADSQGLAIKPPARLDISYSGLLSRTILENQVVQLPVSDPLCQNCDLFDFLGGQGLSSVLVASFRDPQAAIAVIFIAFRVPTVLNQSELQFLNALTEAGGSTLHRFQVMEQLKATVENRTRELKVLNDLMAIAGQSQDMNELLRKSLQRILEAVDYSMGVIHLFDSTDQKLKVAVSVNFYDSLKNYLDVSGVSSQLWEHVFQKQEAIQVSGLPDHRPFPEGSRIGWHYYFYIGVPIQIKGQPGGVLSLFSESDHSLDQNALTWASAAADELGLAILNAQLHNQAREAVVYEERQRLARNLHDSISQSLYTLVVLGDVSVKLLRIKDYAGLRRHLVDIVDTSLHALKEMRLMLFEFRPASLEKVGLAAALEERLNRVESRARIEVLLKVDKDLNLSAHLEQEIYQVAIEALNNALRYSGATRVEVHLHQAPHQVSLAISDNGCGFDLARVSSTGGIGLKSMRERAQILDGTLAIQTAPGQGTWIELTLPIHSSEFEKESGNAT